VKEKLQELTKDNAELETTNEEGSSTETIKSE